MPFDEVPSDDGLMIRDARTWALDKLGIVSCYAGRFAQASKKARFSQVVDAFAGPGVNRIDGELTWGTPVRVLLAEPKVDRLLAMDRDSRSVEALRTRIASDPRATVVRGDVNDELLDVMAGTLERWPPTLALLDPEGTELHFETLRGLSQWRTGKTPVELLVLLATDTGFTRMLTRTGDGFAYAPEKLTRLFGTTAWEPIWRRRQAEGDAPGAADRALAAYVQLYADQLRTLGYRYVLDREIRMRGREGRRGYSLIFASGHTAGENIMDHCFDTVLSSDPQLSMFRTPRSSRLRS